MPTIPNRGDGAIGGFLAHPAFIDVGPRAVTRSSRVLGNRPFPFRSQPFSVKTRSITGITRDASGNPLGGCVVDLYMTATDQVQMSTVSDASGNYRFEDAGAGPFYVVAYKAGAPDVAGASVNTIVPA